MKESVSLKRRAILAAAAAVPAAALAAEADAVKPEAASPEELALGKLVKFRSGVLSEYRSFRVHFSEAAAEAAAAGTPVVLFCVIDGERLFAPVAAFCDYLTGGRMKAAIAPLIVGIDTVGPVVRTRDLTPYASTAGRDGKPVEGGKALGGGAARFLEAIHKEVLPAAEAMLPAGAKVSRRVLMGHSFGGLFTLKALVSGPKPFDDFVAIDPSLWWGEGKFRAGFADAVKALPEGALEGAKVLLGFGTRPRKDRGNLLKSSSAAVEADWGPLFREAGADLTVRLYPNDAHGTVAIPGFFDALKDLIPSVRPAKA